MAPRLNCRLVTALADALSVVRHIAESVADVGGVPDLELGKLMQRSQRDRDLGQYLVGTKSPLLLAPDKACHHPVAVLVEWRTSVPPQLILPEGFDFSEWEKGHTFTPGRPKILSLLMAGREALGSKLRRAIAGGPSWFPGSFVDMLHYLKAAHAFPAYPWDESTRFYALMGHSEGKVCYVAGKHLHTCELQEKIPQGSWISVWV